ncbi:response regulator [Panacibacter sp. DH6]|uniref:Response regulator n=1 Tax=Panacibacter microcysteis TaxID=2793269 RepID=A0A931E2G8_9BACT|nr:response regulator [Panacibacter microcysteis]MBG9377362.1 response regulator [Panacibacter microcysteis]
MRKKILICEDDPDIIELLNLVFIKDYDLKAVRSINDIHSLVTRTEPDLIIMDLWIPLIGGEAAIQQLKEHEETKDIPVVIISASDKIENVYRKTNATAYIPKPFSVSHCRTVVNEILAAKYQENK